jgi:hypothetical protein
MNIWASNIPASFKFSLSESVITAKITVLKSSNDKQTKDP